MSRRWLKLCFSLFLLSVWLCSISEEVRGQSGQAGPVQAVLAWYKVLGDASGAQAQYGGTVGSGQAPFQLASRSLSPTLQERISESAFEESYLKVAHVSLLQAQLASFDEGRQQAEVFVEEERTEVLEKTSASPTGIPAKVWYEGMLRLVEDSGAWRISAIDLTPEDLISVPCGGHQP